MIKVKDDHLVMLVLAIILVIFSVASTILINKKDNIKCGEKLSSEVSNVDSKYYVFEPSPSTEVSTSTSTTASAITEKHSEIQTHSYYDIPLSEDLQNYIMDICGSYNVNHLIVLGMIEQESMYDPVLIGDNGEAFGLMQIQPQWHQDRINRLGVTDLFDPYQNVLVGIDYFAEMVSLGNGIDWALMAYNGGPTYANNKTTSGEISDYVTSVFDNAGSITVVY